MNKIKTIYKKIRFKDFVTILIGTTLISLDVKYFLDPSGLVTGGVSGLAIVIRYLSRGLIDGGIPLWVSNVALNVPIFLYAIYMLGFKSILRTGLSFIIMSIELALLPSHSFLSDNMILTTVYGGLLFGVGMGITLTARATTGGTDLLGQALHAKHRSISMGRMIQILDGAVVLVGAFVFPLEHTLYAILSVFLTGQITDFIVDAGKRAKICIIISDQSQEIAKSILSDLDRGVTGLKGKGMYTGRDKILLLCICSKHDLPDIKDIVREHDKKAFFIIGNISEAMGEGFVEHWR
ncbi:MAG: YitT family protein [Lachnospiraceae bacterium]|nr:YitT family protein [Lachnospiraceae bacterium]